MGEDKKLFKGLNLKWKNPSIQKTLKKILVLFLQTLSSSHINKKKNVNYCITYNYFCKLFKLYMFQTLQTLQTDKLPTEQSANCANSQKWHIAQIAKDKTSK